MKDNKQFLQYLNEFFTNNIDNQEDEYTPEDILSQIQTDFELPIKYIKQTINIFLYDMVLRKLTLRVNDLM